MASGGKRGAGDRVLEGRHVIGLFFLMLLFSGVFFTLGYVMGRNQFEGQVRAEGSSRVSDFVFNSKPDVAPKKSAKDVPQVEPAADPVTPPSSDWEFYHAGDSKASDEHLKSAPANGSSGKAVGAASKNLNASSKPANASASKSASSTTQIPHGAFAVQVAAFTKQADAMNVASNLQRRKFPAYVVQPQGDKYFRVQVGPYPNQKAAEAARKSIESAGFKGIVKRG